MAFVVYDVDVDDDEECVVVTLAVPYWDVDCAEFLIADCGWFVPCDSPSVELRFCVTVGVTDDADALVSLINLNS